MRYGNFNIWKHFIITERDFANYVVKFRGEELGLLSIIPREENGSISIFQNKIMYLKNIYFRYHLNPFSRRVPAETDEFMKTFCQILVQKGSHYVAEVLDALNDNFCTNISYHIPRF